MPRNTRRVSRGSVEVRRKGSVKGWETAEVCTSELSQIGTYLAGMHSRTRVWITAYGTIYHYPVRAGGRVISRGTQDHITIVPNTEYRLLTSERVQKHALRELKAFTDPETGVSGVEYYCIRTKEPLL